MKTEQIVLTIVGAVVIAGGAFYGGMQYQISQGRQTYAGFAGGNGGQFGGGRTGGANGMMRTRPVFGSIISQDAESFTVKLQDGSSKIVLVDDKTTYNKTTVAHQSDMTTGEMISVVGTTNTDGSITAQSVSLRMR
jgi:hypothetical protein